MKKIVAVLAFVAIGFASQAQEVGVRFGDVIQNNVAVDALFSAGKFSRVHADVSFGNSGMGLEALWDFMYRPLGGEALYWYAGVGASTLLFTDPFLLGASGELGLSYTFNKIPISLSAD